MIPPVSKAIARRRAPPATLHRDTPGSRTHLDATRGGNQGDAQSPASILLVSDRKDHHCRLPLVKGELLEGHSYG